MRSLGATHSMFLGAMATCPHLNHRKRLICLIVTCHPPDYRNFNSNCEGCDNAEVYYDYYADDYDYDKYINNSQYLCIHINTFQS